MDLTNLNSSTVENDYLEVQIDIYDRVYLGLDVAKTEYDHGRYQSTRYVLRSMFERMHTGEHHVVKVPLTLKEPANPVSHIQYGVQSLLKRVWISSELNYYDILAPRLKQWIAPTFKSVTHHVNYEYDDIIKVRIVNTPLPEETQRLVLQSQPSYQCPLVP